MGRREERIREKHGSKKLKIDWKMGEIPGKIGRREKC